MFFGKHDRNRKLHPDCRRIRNTRSFHRHDFIDAAAPIQSGNLLRHFFQKHGVDLMIEKTADLENIAGQYFALAENLFFQCFHTATPNKRKKTDTWRNCPISNRFSVPFGNRKTSLSIVVRLGGTVETSEPDNQTYIDS